MLTHKITKFKKRKGDYCQFVALDDQRVIKIHVNNSILAKNILPFVTEGKGDKYDFW